MAFSFQPILSNIAGHLNQGDRAIYHDLKAALFPATRPARKGLISDSIMLCAAK
jgi:hypothetical protein